MALASLGAAAWWWRSRDAGEDSTPATRGTATPASRDALAVRVAIVTDEPWAPTLVVPGTLVPNESVELVSELTRKLVKIHVEEGTVVEKNDVLFELDDDDLLARRARLRAQRGLAKRTVARDDELVATGIAAIESLDQSRTNLDDAQARVRVPPSAPLMMQMGTCSLATSRFASSIPHQPMCAVNSGGFCAQTAYAQRLGRFPPASSAFLV